MIVRTKSRATGAARVLPTGLTLRPRSLSRDDRPGRFRVLTLDGGGTKGFQTLGVLKEIQTMVGVPLGKYFDLIYGTSTGACTAAFLALGARVEDIVAFYRQHIPPVLQERMPTATSQALERFCRTAFGTQDFSGVRGTLGIMCTDWRRERPVVLKSGSTPPGLGCSIARAVRASCSAYPVFDSIRLRLDGLGIVELVDGSYCANNPVLFAIAEAIAGLGQPQASLRVVSVGVGTYRAPRYHGLRGLLHLLKGVGALQKTFGINTASTEQLRRDLFPDVATLRINDHFGQHGIAVDFIESDVRKFDVLFQCGRSSFTRHKAAAQSILT
jgi:hypothetical protein